LAAGRGNTEPGKKAARVIAILGQPRHAKLAPVDARTLKPIRGGWSVSVRWATGAATLSPSAKRAAVQVGGDLGSVLVVDTATGRVEHRLEVGVTRRTGCTGSVATRLWGA
jgi:hypothetical protein